MRAPPPPGTRERGEASPLGGGASPGSDLQAEQDETGPRDSGHPPRPTRGRPVFCQQFIECPLHSERCVGASETAANKTHGELALTELTF